MKKHGKARNTKIRMSISLSPDEAACIKGLAKKLFNGNVSAYVRFVAVK